MIRMDIQQQQLKKPIKNKLPLFINDCLRIIGQIFRLIPITSQKLWEILREKTDTIQIAARRDTLLKTTRNIGSHDRGAREMWGRPRITWQRRAVEKIKSDLYKLRTPPAIAQDMS